LLTFATDFAKKVTAEITAWCVNCNHAIFHRAQLQLRSLRDDGLANFRNSEKTCAYPGEPLRSKPEQLLKTAH
jgi:hypothetical protein